MYPVTESRYWARRMNRRAALRSSGVAATGLAAAALIGCGGDEDEPGTGGGGNGGGTAGAGGAASSPDQVRIEPGLYGPSIDATAAEADPLANGIAGGVLLGDYLDPPQMDLNQVLSCTVVHPTQYSTNRLVRAKAGPLADPSGIELEGDLAESWEASDDGLTFTFNLHQGVKTHNIEPTNGREYTSEDVRLSIERYQASGTQVDVYNDVTSIETPDDYTVVVNMGAPRPDFPLDTGSWSAMYVRELIENEQELQDRLVGTGPFIQEEWTPKERSVFRRHPEYFKAGLPFLDGIEVYVQSDAAAQRAAFQTNNFWDWGARDDIDAKDMASQVDDVVLTKQPLANIPNTRGWWFQMENPLWQDERVRRAISLAFDRDEFDAASGGDNLNPDGAFSFISTPPWPTIFDSYPTAAVQGPWYQFDPEQASQLMQAAGYTADNPLTFEIVGFYQREPIPNLALPLINEALPEVRASWREVDNPTHATLMADRNFDEALGYLIPSFLSFDMCCYPWYHSDGATNYNNVNDAEMDSMLEAQRAESDLEARKEI
ncbi:MAG: hypothetical protein GEU80_04680 [Dehalococcoidia bacterium]|nr:hypothetical protein [Dehalococcoidia bacterium]